MSLINTVKTSDYTGATYTSATLAATSLTSGNLIIVAVSSFKFFAAPPTPAITDTAGNTYILATSTADGGSNFDGLFVFYCLNAVGHSSNVVTATFSGGPTSYLGLMSAQYSGIASGAALDVATSNAGGFTSGTSFTSSSFTTGLADELIVAISRNDHNASNTFTAGSGFTLQNSDFDLALQDCVVDVAQSGATVGVTSTSSGHWMMAVLSFKLAPVSGTLLTLQSIPADVTVIGTPLLTPTQRKAFIGIQFGRRSASALTEKMILRVEGSMFTAANRGWFPLAQFGTSVDAVAIEAVNGSCSAAQNVVPLASTTGFALGDMVYIDNGTIANSEWGRVKSISTNTSVTLEDNLANAQTGATVYSGAELFCAEVDLESVVAIRLVCSGPATGQATAVRASIALE